MHPFHNNNNGPYNPPHYYGHPPPPNPPLYPHPMHQLPVHPHPPHLQQHYPLSPPEPSGYSMPPMFVPRTTPVPMPPPPSQLVHHLQHNNNNPPAFPATSFAANHHASSSNSQSFHNNDNDYQPKKQPALPRAPRQQPSSTKPPSSFEPSASSNSSSLSKMQRASKNIRDTRIAKLTDTRDEVEQKINSRVQDVIELLCKPLSDTQLQETIFSRCLKCKNESVAATSNIASSRIAEATRSKSRLVCCIDELFCNSCIMDVCDMCWLFVKGEERQNSKYAAHFKQMCQKSDCCSTCLSTCWICARHIKPPQTEISSSNSSSSSMQSLATIEQRIFNKYKNRATVEPASRMSRQAYVTEARRVCKERHDILNMFNELTILWKSKSYMNYAETHKLLASPKYAFTWRQVRNRLMIPEWLRMLIDNDKKRMRPVILDGRALDIYQRCADENLLNVECENVNSSAYHGLPNIPSAEYARSFFAGKRIVIMGDSIGRHVYRDLINLLQGDGPLSGYFDHAWKGDEQYANDICLFGSHHDVHRWNAKNATDKAFLSGKDWYEHRIFYGPCQITVEYVWVTRVWNETVEQDLLKLFDFEAYRTKYKLNRTPDVIIFNSCLWDVTKYGDRTREIYRQNCSSFASFWYNQIASKISLPHPTTTAHQQQVPIFINYTTPKPGQKVTGDLVNDLSADDRQAMMADLHVRETRRWLHEAMLKASTTIGVQSRIGYVDLYNACEKFFLESFRFADGVHYDPPAMRIFTAAIIAQCEQLFDVSRSRHASSSSSSNKRDLDAVTDNAVDISNSLDTQWLDKCHDLASAQTISYYNAHTRPPEFALRQWRNGVKALESKKSVYTEQKVRNCKKLEFFAIGPNGRMLSLIYPIKELPTLMTRLYAALQAVLDDFNRLVLIRQATSSTVNTSMPSTAPNLSWERVANQCGSGLRESVRAIIDNALVKKQPMIHYGPMNGFYANEFYVRICCVHQILQHTPYCVELFRFVRNTCDPMYQREYKDKFQGSQNFIHSAIEEHVTELEGSKPPVRWLSEDEYRRGYDLAEGIFGLAKQPPPSTKLVDMRKAAALAASAAGIRSKPFQQQQQHEKAAAPKSGMSAYAAALAARKNKRAGSSAGNQSVGKGGKQQSDNNKNKNGAAAGDGVIPARPRFGRAQRVDDDGNAIEGDLESEESDEEENLDADQYVIADIADIRFNVHTWSGDQLEYLVVWKHWPGEDTWEPLECVDGCQPLIDEFNSRPGVTQRKIELVREGEAEEARQKAREARIKEKMRARAAAEAAAAADAAASANNSSNATSRKSSTVRGGDADNDDDDDDDEIVTPKKAKLLHKKAKYAATVAGPSAKPSLNKVSHSKSTVNGSMKPPTISSTAPAAPAKSSHKTIDKQKKKKKKEKLERKSKDGDKKKHKKKRKSAESGSSSSSSSSSSSANSKAGSRSGSSSSGSSSGSDSDSSSSGGGSGSSDDEKKRKRKQQLAKKAKRKQEEKLAKKARKFARAEKRRIKEERRAKREAKNSAHQQQLRQEKTSSTSRENADTVDSTTTAVVSKKKKVMPSALYDDDNLEGVLSSLKMRYSKRWRTTSVAAGVRQNFHLKAILALLPSKSFDTVAAAAAVSPHAMLSSSSSSLPSAVDALSLKEIIDNDDAVGVAQPKKVAERFTIYTQQQSVKSTVSNDAAPVATAATSGGGRLNFAPLQAALVSWQESDDAEVVELAFLHRYYKQEFRQAMLFPLMPVPPSLPSVKIKDAEIGSSKSDDDQQQEKLRSPDAVPAENNLDGT